VRVPDALGWWRGVPGGPEWLDDLPSIVASCADRWSLRVGEPFPDGHVSLVVPVERQSGAPAVLKINFPEEESAAEPDALLHWDGDGAVRLLAHDEATRALLVERCVPGSQLWSIDDDVEATSIAAGVLRRLWRPPPREHRFRALRNVAARWAEELARDWKALGKPFESELSEAAIQACLELPNETNDQVVLHQDFHGGNVLRAEREPWLAIDPKPLVGEPAFDAASLLRDRRWLLGSHDDARRIARRLDQLSEELFLDRERMRLWGIAHALAWGVSGHKLEDDMVACARLLHSARS
jgi:streptomycin 6-kinase